MTVEWEFWVWFFEFADKCREGGFENRVLCIAGYVSVLVCPRVEGPGVETVGLIEVEESVEFAVVEVEDSEVLWGINSKDGAVLGNEGCDEGEEGEKEKGEEVEEDDEVDFGVHGVV